MIRGLGGLSPSKLFCGVSAYMTVENAFAYHSVGSFFKLRSFFLCKLNLFVDSLVKLHYRPTQLYFEKENSDSKLGQVEPA